MQNDKILLTDKRTRDWNAAAFVPVAPRLLEQRKGARQQPEKNPNGGSRGSEHNQPPTTTHRDQSKNTGRGKVPIVPACIAVNAAIAGVSYNDMEFYVESDRDSSFANRAMLDEACPLLLKKIQTDSKLFLDDASDSAQQWESGERTESMPYAVATHHLLVEDVLSTPTAAGNNDENKNEGALHWLKSAAGLHGKRVRYKPDKTLLATKEHANRRQSMLGSDNNVEARYKHLQHPEAIERSSSSRMAMTMQRVHVFGCSTQTLRALLFYLLTNKFRLVDTYAQQPIGRPTSSLSTKDHQLLVGQEPLSQSWANSPPALDVQAAYSLSSLLHLAPLQDAAQQHILAHLQTHSVLLRYFSPFAQRFSAIRRGMMAFIESNWHDVRDRPETQQALARLAHGDFPESHRALFKLLCRMDVNPSVPPPATPASWR